MRSCGNTWPLSLDCRRHLVAVRGLHLAELSVYVTACQSNGLMNSRVSFSLRPKVYVTACQSVPLMNSRVSFSLRPKVYVTACQSVPLSIGIGNAIAHSTGLHRSRCDCHRRSA